MTHSINGVANASSQTYDALGRVTNLQNPLGSFTLSYQNQTNRMTSIIYPNGQHTDYEYWNRTAPNNAASGEKGDSLRRLKRITNLGGGSGLAVLSDFYYHYDQAGRITDWTRAATGEPAESADLSYDAADQLTGAILRNAGTVIREQFYRYDLAGNRTRNQLGLASQKGHYDTRNQLTELTADDQLTFTGTVSEPSQVRVAGNLARVEADGRWRVDAPVLAGENNLALTATDRSGNVTSKTIQLTVAGLTTESFTYDLNGNTTSDGQRSYEWDAANRLVAINQLGTVPLKRSEFTYDGASRNTRIVEKEATNIISDKRFVYLGTNKAEERNPANTVTKRYYPQGFTLNPQPSTTELFFYTRDHLGSIREVTDATGTLRASYKYDLYGQRTKTTGDIESDFGFTNQYHHEPSGLDLFLYRAYNPKTARWLSPDPIGESGGINLYGYVGNNPIGRLDSYGLDAASAGGGYNMFVVNPASHGFSDFNSFMNYIANKWIAHPKVKLTGQCAVGAQYVGGKSLKDGGIGDVASASSWKQGNPVTNDTIVGTVIAKGWRDDQTYPNGSASAGTGNHTGIYAGGGQYWSQNNNGGGPWIKQNLSPGNWSVVTSPRSTDSTPTASYITTVRPATNQ